ncbi:MULTISPECIES: bacillithiol biosynthesis deacetylase BshB1 [Brevibacillus]|uniref:Bacillithiol biosynthesis deacetylase BshB1 n=1 Tax=Brevibacillus invocatus TaxID=173959 RepID=A0A3M8CI31_9BACL|nr:MULTISPECIES: bacillithiol biosynthesis deacetylase BshB1 [Brevibacillus]CFJ31693.1 putative LmbE-like protein [Mycobacterium tuberculosis]MCM3077863.1 bacillithiol biosynthesis deacetylase BshB1 [Brevibacillus invocatus]MCM3428063.1 bacillithiol biosynthesis deacetylase BshB1 [Brevibacillus invocatus]MDH4616048.1 bacillithiol biosynthesis deacetylase BshB1 [Brevibacillus sp. AY1]RNB75319.1 bacillithiol biosynthesis deacetylase BshB1 [Brevibacillus invocatus]
MNSLDILAIGAHPDDVEIGASGSLLLAAKQGQRVGILDLTYAELSSNGNVERRQQEAAEADRLLGVCARYNFGLPDRGLESVREEAIRRVVELIRQTRPRVVLAPYFQDRHPDHESVSRIVREAVFSSGIRKYQPSETLVAYRPAQLLYYFINSTVTPQVVVDVTAVYPEKLDVLRCYRSQFELEAESVDTPLTNGYLEMVEYRERLFGQQAGVRYAEGFMSATPYVLPNL